MLPHLIGVTVQFTDTCEQDQKTLHIGKSAVYYKGLIFCNKQCALKWLAENGKQRISRLERELGDAKQELIELEASIDKEGEVK